MKLGNKIRASHRGWFIEYAELLFPFIFPERSENENDESYLTRVQRLAKGYLERSDPRFLYPLDDFVSFSFIV